MGNHWWISKQKQWYEKCMEWSMYVKNISLSILKVKAIVVFLEMFPLLLHIKQMVRILKRDKITGWGHSKLMLHLNYTIYTCFHCLSSLEKHLKSIKYRRFLKEKDKNIIKSIAKCTKNRKNQCAKFSFLMWALMLNTKSI